MFFLSARKFGFLVIDVFCFEWDTDCERISRMSELILLYSISEDISL